MKRQALIFPCRSPPYDPKSIASKNSQPRQTRCSPKKPVCIVKPQIVLLLCVLCVLTVNNQVSLTAP